MKTGITELVFILDRSGSMNGLESDTIGGFNSMIDRQKKEDSKVYVTTVLFDDELVFIHERCPIEQVTKLTKEVYFARGCTALLDTIGISIEKTAEALKKMPNNEKADKVIFVIITDGLENSSEEFTYRNVKSLIEARKKCGWEFLFLGANIDAGREAEKIGIARNRSVTYENDAKGVAINYATVGKTIIKATVSENSTITFDENWADEIEEYHKEKTTSKLEE